MQTIGVVGAGAWGTALAQIYAKGGAHVVLWALEPDVVEAVNATRENSFYLKGVMLDPKIRATNRLGALSKCEILLLVTPAQHIRTVLTELKGEISAGTVLVICSKGIEQKTGILSSEICREILPDNPVAVLTGPTFATEIAIGMPAAVTLAVGDKDVAKILQKALGLKHFRPYLTDDIIGAQLGGAIKNVIAIACGIVYGRKLGESACAALLTRGLAEMGRLAVAMGAKRQTLMGMCGMGDLILTATSLQSRNFSFGAALGEGQSKDDILGRRSAVTEGVYTVESTLALAKKYGVDMPITEAVYQCLYQKKSVDEVIESLLGRPLRNDSVDQEE